MRDFYLGAIFGSFNEVSRGDSGNPDFNIVSRSDSHFLPSEDAFLGIIAYLNVYFRLTCTDCDCCVVFVCGK